MVCFFDLKAGAEPFQFQFAGCFLFIGRRMTFVIITPRHKNSLYDSGLNTPSFHHCKKKQPDKIIVNMGKTEYTHIVANHKGKIYKWRWRHVNRLDKNHKINEEPEFIFSKR